MFLKRFLILQESICVEFFFNKVEEPKNCNFIKSRLQHRFFHVKFAKILKTPGFTEHFQWLLLTVLGIQPSFLLEKRLRQKCFSVKFAKILRTSFLLTEHLWMTTFCVYLWILRCFSEHFFYKAPLGICLFHVEVAEFEPLNTVKNYFAGAFQAFYTRTRSSLSKEFIYLKSLKTISEEVNL